MKYEKFENIPVWQEARSFVAKVYAITNAKFQKDYEMTNQLRRATLSIALNIAEGFERSSNKDFARFIGISKASAGECRAIFYIALDLKYISESEFKELKDNVVNISKQLSKLSKYLIDSAK